MNDLLRVRVEPKLIKEADKVCREIGTSSGEVIRMMLRQLVRRRSIPFPTMADSPEDEVVGTPEQQARRFDDSL